MAILAIRLVDVESGMPIHPIIPKFMIIGKQLGTKAIRPTFTDRNIKNIMLKMRIKPSKILLVWPATSK